MDGVAGVSHCPINPGETFEYRFIASPPGTYWYYSHVGLQRSDGLYGPLIVLHENEDTNKEFYMILQDWYHDESWVIANGVKNGLNRFTKDGNYSYNHTQCYDPRLGETHIQSVIINGRGQYHPPNGQTSPYPTLLPHFRVKFSKERPWYKFRVTGAQLMYPYRVSIDGHSLYVTATDGFYVKERKVESIIINPGERYDVRIKTANVISSSKYWIRVQLFLSNAYDSPAREFKVGVLNYGSDTSLPTSQRQACTPSTCEIMNCPMSETNVIASMGVTCVPVSDLNSENTSITVPSSANMKEYFLNFHSSGLAHEPAKSSINGRQFVTPSSPLQITQNDDSLVPCDGKHCAGEDCKCSYKLDVAYDSVVQLVLFNLDTDVSTAYPVHIHGHHFHVLRTGFRHDIQCTSPQCTTAKWANDTKPDLNTKNPPIKDTVTIPIGGYVVVRFRANNAGYWLIHSQNGLNLFKGMAMILKVGGASDMPSVPKYFPTCGTFTYGNPGQRTAANPYESGNNEANPSCGSGVKVCEFKWEVGYKDTMIWNNQTTGEGLPVINTFQNGMWKPKVRLVQGCGQRDLTDKEKEEITFTDGYHRGIYTINGKFPGPPIIVYDGTEVVIHVTNNLIMEGVTLHWHGMVQRGTPWMDGVGTISQCPIQPGETFTYRFKATPPGTHWYHSHLGTQRTDGLYGALIVLENAQEKLDFEHRYQISIEDSFIMLVQDWFHEESLKIVNGVYYDVERFTKNGEYDYDHNMCFHATKQWDNTEASPTQFQSIMINGKGVHFPHKGNVPEFNTPLTVYTIEERNKQYRFRVIGAQMVYGLRISLDEHPLQVVTSDGNEVEGTFVESLIVNSGERFDFVVNASKPTGNYWIRVETLEARDMRERPVQKGQGLAILRYRGAPMANPTTSRKACTINDQCIVLNCPFRFFPESHYSTCIPLANLTSTPAFIKRHPVPEYDRTSKPLVQHFVNFHFSGMRDNTMRSSVNGRQFVPPLSPPQTYPKKDPFVPCTEDDCIDEHCICTYKIEIPVGSTVQMVLLNIGEGSGLGGMAHPVHIHGHHFHVMKMGFPTYSDPNDDNFRGVEAHNEDFECFDLQTGIWALANNMSRCNKARWSVRSWSYDADSIPGLNLINPPVKDTVIVPSGGYVVVRFKADNPGYWFAHCHIEIHQVEGMAFVIREGNQSEMASLPSGFNKCGSFWWTQEEKQAVSERPLLNSGPNYDIDFFPYIMVLNLGILSYYGS